MPSDAAIKLHLEKAGDFLLAAEICREANLWDAAVSNAVSAAINASDVLILRGGGVVARGREHSSAATLLKRFAGAEAARQYTRALGSKNKAQYETARCTSAQADDAIRGASRLLDKAKVRQ